MSMTVKHQVFESLTKSWESLCDEVAEFASQIGRDRLINISIAASGGNALGNFGNGVIVVWYWE
jgi:hypothetical protein